MTASQSQQTLGAKDCSHYVSGTEAVKALMDGKYIRSTLWTRKDYYIYLHPNDYNVCAGQLETDGSMIFMHDYNIAGICNKIHLKRKNWVIVEPDTVTSEFINALKHV